MAASSGRSLTLRLVLTSAVGIALALIAAGALLILLFTGYIERRFDASLRSTMAELIASVEVESDGSIGFSRIPSNPLFRQPLSGWYWQISLNGILKHQSSSSDQSRRLPMTDVSALNNREENWVEVTGPKDQRLRSLVRYIRLPDTVTGHHFLVAGPRQNIEIDVKQFGRQMFFMMGILAIGLLAALVFQVKFGLRPIRTLSADIGKIRRGDLRRLESNHPAEFVPLVVEINDLLGHNETIIDRARTQAANLAHAVKNPLTVIQNESAQLESNHGKIIREQVRQLDLSVDRHLSRFRSAGAGHSAATRTSVRAVVDDLIFSMELIYHDRSIDIGVSGLDKLIFRGDRQDLEEMLGNLLDNACKWTNSRITVSGEEHGHRIAVHIEDDGKGIPREARDKVVQSGTRLDESVSGTGLGLAIVQDIVSMYGGLLTLDSVEGGGTRATLELPGQLDFVAPTTN